MNVLSLFDGMSCAQIALNRAGIKYDKYFASEIDKYAIQVTQKNYPETIQLGDITKIKATDLPPIDLIIGGSPCQGFSLAGKQLNFDDDRSKLFFEFVRLVKEIKPKHFILENVNMKKEWRDIITEQLGTGWVRINSALVSAQNRVRLYWCNFPINELPMDKGILLKDVIEDNSVTDRMKSYALDTHYQGAGLASYKRRRKQVVFEVEKKVLPFVSPDFKNSKVRKLTPVECERLQTVPDNYTEDVSNSQRYKMLGNGFTVDVIVHLLKQLEQSNKTRVAHNKKKRRQYE